MPKKATNGEDITKNKSGEMSLAEIKGKSEAMQKMVDETQVTNDDELNSVAEKIKGIKLLGKYVRQEMEKYTKPAQQIINEARAKYLPYEKICAGAEAQLKSKAAAYMMEVEKKRREAEAKVEKKLEDGAIKESTALKRMEKIGEEKKTVTTAGGAKLTMRTVQEVVITDKNLVPDEYWVIDEVKVRKVALAGVEIPGVEVRETKSMSA